MCFALNIRHHLGKSAAFCTGRVQVTSVKRHWLFVCDLQYPAHSRLACAQKRTRRQAKLPFRTVDGNLHPFKYVYLAQLHECTSVDSCSRGSTAAQNLLGPAVLSGALRFFFETKEIERVKSYKQLMTHLSPALQGEVARELNEVWVKKAPLPA